MTAGQQAQPETTSPTKRVLLVDDEPMIRAITAEYLMMCGYEVAEAAHGAAAWDILQGDADFDVVVTDRRMPEMDGAELAQRVKGTPRLSGLPVVMQTGAMGKKEIDEAVKAGVFHFLAKPYDEITLAAVMDAALRDGRQRKWFAQRLRTAPGSVPRLAETFSLRTVGEAQELALLLGAAFAQPEPAANGLYELLLNAVEHGNLKLGYEAKRKALAEGGWDAEIARRAALPENAEKRVDVAFARSGEKIEITIRDQGDGFDPRPYMEITPSRAMHGNGRGIAKVNLQAFERLEYLGNGSAVNITGI